jgi:glycosyltransferase involved in cell wall biosynthesis
VKVLIVHPVYPGQFGLIADAFCQDGAEVKFLSHAGRAGNVGYSLDLYSLVSKASPDAHPHLIGPEQAMLHAEGCMVYAKSLKARGFEPDVIIGHAGFGQVALLRDVFPSAHIVAYAEYYYRSYGADVGFDPELALPLSDFPRIRLKNAATLLSLDAADVAYTPTAWQRDLFPVAYRQKIAVIHDGIDTARFSRHRSSAQVVAGRRIAPNAPLITYAARSLEHYRGFHKFWPALRDVMNSTPKAQAIVVGVAEPAYGPEGNEDLVQRLMSNYPIDEDRVSMVSALSRTEYIELLGRSSCHVYLSYPFVPSWSLIEAMASGAPLVVSDVGPIREIVGRDTCHGVDFFDTDALADAITDTILDKKNARRRAKRARDRAIAEYDFKSKSWPQLRQLMAASLAVGRT